MTRENDSVLVLASGGIDSTALIEYYASKKYKVSALFFDYGQISRTKELQAVRKVCSYYGIKLEEAQLGFTLKNTSGEFIGRNALFITSAFNFLPNNYSKISIGIHSGTPYYDCSKTFVEDFQRIVDGYFEGTVLIDVPFVEFTKGQIIEYCLQENVPINLTYSCENGYEKNCGKCLSCLDRREFLGKSDLM
ncbi:7-cyano-7-deazaguanine synthase [Lysinibacillus macroides]|uniref:7-cyano-7-deazaguanine synthase n=1 Tax=Lysinibacillus macroides TaxID=33935 RepID=A0A0N0CVN3_9BACI|nr:7-cyano-7-deazaguanine synthase [Lysinibacillus macroides]KOY81874.1 hypothetical protein ADM90_13265 [Lysinibacillus macroides]